MHRRLIFIGLSFFAFLSVVILVIYQFQQVKIYDNFTTTQKLADWIISGIKNKDRAKVRVPMCLEPSMERSSQDVDSAFEVFWESVQTEDWSQINVKNVNKEGLQTNYTFAVKNIKNQKGEIGNRYFGMQPRYRNRFTYLPIISDVFTQQYSCFEPNSFMNLEESYKFENLNPSVEKPEIKK